MVPLHRSAAQPGHLHHERGRLGPDPGYERAGAGLRARILPRRDADRLRARVPELPVLGHPARRPQRARSRDNPADREPGAGLRQQSRLAAPQPAELHDHRQRDPEADEVDRALNRVPKRERDGRRRGSGKGAEAEVGRARLEGEEVHDPARSAARRPRERRRRSRLRSRRRARRRSRRPPGPARRARRRSPRPSPTTSASHRPRRSRSSSSRRRSSAGGRLDRACGTPAASGSVRPLCQSAQEDYTRRDVLGTGRPEGEAL